MMGASWAATVAAVYGCCGSLEWLLILLLPRWDGFDGLVIASAAAVCVLVQLQRLYDGWHCHWQLALAMFWMLWMGLTCFCGCSSNEGSVSCGIRPWCSTAAQQVLG
jgi:hypothetical protein